MTNEMKLLRAFIEASGYDIETKENIMREYSIDDIGTNGQPKVNAMPTNILKTTEYEVVKKTEGDPLPCDKCSGFRYGMRHEVVYGNKFNCKFNKHPSGGLL
tara:strand:- start:40 stop:345 length:306 start_codon:yes stop_codon:yes gene_type:complete